MTSTPVGHVDFSMLTSELRILPIAPSWAEVERAMERLDSLPSESWSEAQKDEQVHRDNQTVQDFSQNLEENRESLALALYCAAILGTACSGSQGERLAAGLRAISRCYRFHRLSREERLHELQILAEEIQRRLEISALEPPPDVAAEQWKEWWEQVRTKSKRLEEEEPWARATEDAWDLWATRLLEDFIERNILVFRPQLADVASAVGQKGPSRLFSFDLAEMTLVAWSQAFLEVSQFRGISNRFVAPTFLQLIGPHSKEIKIDNLRFVEEILRPIQQAAKTPLSFIIRRSHSALIEALYPASVAGLIAFDLGQLLQCQYASSLRPVLLLIELPIEVEMAALWKVTAKSPIQAAARVAEVVKSSLNSQHGMKHVYVVPQDARVDVPDDAPVIYGAKDADDLLLQAQSLTGIDLTKKIDSEPVKSSKPRKRKSEKEDG